MAKTFHSGSIKKSIIIKSNQEKVWRTISDIVGLPKWVVDVKSCKFKTKTKRGIGAIREIIFLDGNKIEEHVISWDTNESFSYVAVSGLPLRAYVATITLSKQTKNSTRVIWKSYLNSKKMTQKEFTEFLVFMGTFYQSSLENLKMLLE